MTRTQADFHLHETYWTKLEDLIPTDLSDFHRLSVSVNWPHRPQDIETVMGLGRGYFARDQIARPIGAGMWFDYDCDASMIGMMMTHPKLQAGGLGGEILAKIETQIAGRRLRLNSTISAYQLYRNAGFHDCATVVQYQGLVRAEKTAMSPGVRPATPEDVPAIKALDLVVFGATRTAVLMRLLERSQAFVLEEAGKIIGFAMYRSFGRGHVIGPLVAPSEGQAIHLFTAIARDHDGAFLRLDADVHYATLGAHLNAAGLESYDKVVAMTKGAHFGPEDADGYIYALASQALG